MKTILCVCSAILFATLPTSAEDGKIPEPVDAVKKLYTDHLANKGVLVDEAARKNWPFIFGENLVKVLKSENWGFDPLVFAQDHELKELAFKEIDRDDAGNVFVLVSFKNFDQSVRLIVAMKHTDHGFRIENIVEPATGIDLIHDISESEK